MKRRLRLTSAGRIENRTTAYESISNDNIFSARLLTLVCALGLVIVQAQVAFAQTGNITVQVDKPGARIPATLFGLFFEDINFGADGGLYPERVKNRSFEFPDPLMGWKQIDPGDSKGAVYVLDQGSVKDVPNSHYLRIKVETPGGGFGVVNEGFRGIGVEKGAEYIFSVRARRVDGAPAGLIVRTRRRERARAGANKNFWRDTGVEEIHIHHPRHRDRRQSRLSVLAEGRGTLDVDLISLYPKDTWQNRENGLRSDLVKLLKEMKPGFLRFPGGCIVEGSHLERRYQWKTTIGDLDERSLTHQPLELRVQAPPGAGLLPVIRARILRVLPAERRHRGRTAADSQLRHGLSIQHGRVSPARRTRSLHSGRYRPDRVCQRPGHDRLGPQSAPRWATRRRST